jgi:predicted RNase H-like HicB family nuclease
MLGPPRHGIVVSKHGDMKMKREFNVVIEQDEDGYFVALVPALRGCHTQAKSLDILMKRIKEAIELCLEVEEPVSNQFVGVQRVAVMA